MSSNLVVYLEISSWQGVSFGAVHCYGKLYHGETRVKLSKTLSVAEARYLSQKDDWHWRRGDQTDRFRSKDELIALAVKTWRGHFPGAVLLVKGNHCYAEPQFVLDGPEDVKAAINALVSRAEQVGHWNNPRAMQAIYDEWDEIMRGLDKSG